LPLARIGELRDDPFAPIVLESLGAGKARIAFDETWAATAYASIPPKSIEGMLRSQGAAMIGARGGVAAGKSRPLAPIEGLLYILLLIPSLLRMILGRGSERSSRKAGLRLVA
jgi:hypothetical protein